MESIRVVGLRLAPWVALGALAAWAFGLPGLLAGTALLALTEALQAMREREAMKGAHAVAVARRMDDATALAAKVEALEAKVKELATPERMEATRVLLEQMKRLTPVRR